MATRASGDALATAGQRCDEILAGLAEIDEALPRETLEGLANSGRRMIDPHAQLEVGRRTADVCQIAKDRSLDVIESHVAVLYDLPEQTLVRRAVCQLCHAPDSSRNVGGVKREVCSKDQGGLGAAIRTSSTIWAKGRRDALRRGRAGGQPSSGEKPAAAGDSARNARAARTIGEISSAREATSRAASSSRDHG